MKAAYTSAVIDVLESGVKPDQVISNLTTALKAKGHQSLLPAVLREVLRRIESKTSTQVPLVYIAKEGQEKEYQPEIIASLKKLGCEQKPTYVVDETIIGGFIIIFNNKAIDNSYKSQLQTIYKNVTI